jgi:hypothetical protein
MTQRTGYPSLPRLEPECECSAVAKAWGIVGVLLGVVGFLVQPIVFGPLALTAGIFAVRMRSRRGWWGIGLGTAQLVFVAVVLSRLSEPLGEL